MKGSFDKFVATTAKIIGALAVGNSCSRPMIGEHVTTGMAWKYKDLAEERTALISKSITLL